MQDPKNDISSEIRKFLAREVIFSSHLPPEYSNEEDLVSLGVIDSLGLVTIITFLEDKFGISITNRDLSELNFRSVSAMVHLVQGKRSGNG